MAGTARRRSPTPRIDVVGPGRSETHMFSNWPILFTRSWCRRRHLNLEVLEVLVSRVTLSLATTHGVRFTSCLFPRGGMLCPAPSRHAPTNHITDMFHKAPPRRGGVLQTSKCQWRTLHLQLRTRSVQSGSDTVMKQDSGSLCHT